MIDVMKQALEALKRLNDIDGMYSWVDTEQALRQAIEQAEKPTRNAADFLAEKQGAFRDPRVLIMEFYKPEKEPWDTSDMAHRSGGLSVEQAEKQEPVAWVRDLTSPQPHCVTSMKYLSIADTDAGVKYIPVYAAPPQREWVGLSDSEAEIYANQFNGIRLVKGIEALLKRRNT